MANLIALIFIYLFVNVAHANELVDQEYIYKIDQLQGWISSDVRSLCLKKFKECEGAYPKIVKSKDRVKYSQIKLSSQFDFILHVDCNRKNEKTITYICHMKVTPSIEADGLKFNTSPVEKIEMK